MKSVHRQDAKNAKRNRNGLGGFTCVGIFEEVSDQAVHLLGTAHREAEMGF